jgi:hypothetical protein
MANAFKSAEDYFNDYQASQDEYEKQFSQYEQDFDTFQQSFYRDGAFLPTIDVRGRGAGASGTRINRPNSLFQSGGFTGVVRQDSSSNRVYAQSGEIRQAQTLSTTAPSKIYSFGTQGESKKTFRDPVSGLQYDIASSASDIGREIAPNTYAFFDGSIIQIPTEPEAPTAPMAFNKERFEELLDEPLIPIETRNEQEKQKIREIDEQRQQSERDFAAEMANLEKENKATIAQLQEDAQETQTRLTNLRGLIDQEEEERLRKTGAERAGYVRARRLRGQPILGGNE